MGYQDNINLFSIGFNYFLHPVTSYSVYDELKSKIEQVYTQTGRKSIFISFEQGSSFISMFLSNYSNTKWVEKYIDSVIFLSPTFAGFPSISNFASQTYPPFISNTEFKKSLMHMPGLFFTLPNYFVYKNFTLKENSKTYNASNILEFLKNCRKVDNESERIFKATVEKYIKSPIPEPPIPSLIIIDDKISKTSIKPIISIKEENRYEECVQLSSQHAISRWKSSKLVQSNRPSQIIFEYINGRSSPPRIMEGDDPATVNDDIRIQINTLTGHFTDTGYVTSHTVNSSEYNYTGPAGKANYPLSNAFDTNAKSYYVSDTENNDTFHNTYEIMFKDPIALEAFLYDTAFGTTSDKVRTFHGFPTLLHAYTSFGGGPYKLSGIFEGTPIYPWTRIVFEFKEAIICDKLKLEFVNVTNQTMNNAGGPSMCPTIAGLLFIRRLFISSEDIYNNIGYMKAHVIPSSEFTYTASEGMNNYPISNAFDDNYDTYYISKEANTESHKNFIEISFKKKEKLQMFFIDQIVSSEGIVQGYPTKVNVYASVGNEPYTLKTKFDGPPNPTWKRVCFNFYVMFECDKLKIEFVEVSSQTIVGDSTNLVISDIYFIRFMNETKYTGTNYEYSSEAYLNTYSVDPSKFVYSGDEGQSDYPLSNAFDRLSYTSYISSTTTNDSYAIPILINFTEEVSLTDIVYGYNYYTNLNGFRTYEGYPYEINVYASIGNEPYVLTDVFVGKPESPMTKVQLHFKNVVHCDKLKLEFVNVSLQTSTKPNLNNLVINSIYFIPVHESEILRIEGATGDYLNDEFIRSNMVHNSEFTYTIDEGLENYSESYLFDLNTTSFYISSIPINDTHHTILEVKFKEQVGIKDILIDTHYFTSGSTRTFRGTPTGIKVYSSIFEDEYKLYAFFVGEPVYPMTRIRYAFPDDLQCDKLKIEFVHVTMQSQVGKSYSLLLSEIYLIKGLIRPTQTPTSSQSPSPIFTEIYVPITEVCKEGSHCSYEGSVENQISVTITTTIFNSIQSNENGGAILLKNAGLLCSNISFNGCQTSSQGNSSSSNSDGGGGGGGIYIKNEIEITSSVILNNINFSNCKANYGGAVYVYSSSIKSTVNIIKCFFSGNYATSARTKSSSSSSELNGGGAVYITSKSSYLSDCSFVRNFGENQLKIDSVFENSAILLSNKQIKTTNMIRYCRFVINRQSKSSVYYTADENGVPCYLSNSVFIGDLMPGNYHIDGRVLLSYSPRLIVTRCKFSSDYSRAFNSKDTSNEYVVVQFQKQTFDYSENEEDDNKDIYGYVIFGVVAVIVLVIIFVVKKQCESAQLEKKAGH